MFLRFLKSSYRSFNRNTWLTSINMLGLALGIACCVMISLYLISEKSFDKHHTKADRIYRVYLNRIYATTNVKWASIPPAVRDGLLAEFPEVVDATRIRAQDMDISKSECEQRFSEKVILVDSSFFNLFSIPQQEGNARQAIKHLKSVVITRHFADKYFNGTPALGQTISVGELGEFSIQAIVDDCPKSSHFQYDIILSLKAEPGDLTVWDNNFGYYTYILLHDRTQAKALAEKLPLMTEKYLGGMDPSGYAKWKAEGNDYAFLLQRLLDIHLYSDLRWEMEPNGNYVYFYLFAAAGILVLIIAMINFMNLSTARYSTRLREIGIRKILGSKRIRIMGQFLLESILLSALSMLLAIGIIEVTLPFLNPIIGQMLFVDYGSATTVLSLVLFTVILGTLSGIYPSVLLSGFQATQVIRSSSVPIGMKSGFRNGLITAQFGISFFLIVATFTVFHQMKFMMNKRLGYNKENVLVLKDVNGIAKKDALKNELTGNPRIQSVAFSSEVPGTMNGSSTFRYKGDPGHDVNMTILFGDEDVFHTWGMEMVQGRNLRPEDFTDTVRNIILNETAVKMFGITSDPIGKELLNQQGRSQVVVGVVRDFHLESLQKEIRPLILLPTRDWVNSLSIRITGDNVPGTVAFVEGVWKKFSPQKPIQYFFLDDHYQALYQSEKTTATLLFAFSSMALIISALGLAGLSAFTTEQRTKEISIRKVMGASVGGILMLILKSILRPIVIATLIATPLSWIGATEWLAGFAYRIDLTPWPFAIAFLLTVLIAGITIVAQSYRAANNSPVNALRTS